MNNIDFVKASNTSSGVITLSEDERDLIVGFSCRLEWCRAQTAALEQQQSDFYRRLAQRKGIDPADITRYRANLNELTLEPIPEQEAGADPSP